MAISALKVLRKFSIKPTRALLDENPDVSLDKVYPVIAIDDSEDGTFVLIADDVNEFHWVELAMCFLGSIDE